MLDQRDGTCQAVAAIVVDRGPCVCFAADRSAGKLLRVCG